MCSIEDQVDELPELVADHLGLIRRVTPSFCEAFDWRPEDLNGKPIAVLVPPGLEHAHHLGFSRFLETERPTLFGQPLRLHVRRGDGREQMAELCIDGQASPGGWIFHATVVPLGEGE